MAYFIATFQFLVLILVFVPVFSMFLPHLLQLHPNVVAVMVGKTTGNSLGVVCAVVVDTIVPSNGTWMMSSWTAQSISAFILVHQQYGAICPQV